MIRVVTFLLAVAVLAAGFAWLADRPGEVATAKRNVTTRIIWQIR